MKVWRILVFIVLVIGLLTAFSLLVPTDELKCCGFTLKIPKPETIIGGDEEEFIDPEDIIIALEVQQVDSTYKSLDDTIAYYQNAMALPTKFSLPHDDYTYYDTFFALLESAYSQQRTVRILHYGDSQIELDRISNNIRDYFQSHFGGGGPGMLSLYNSVPSRTIRQSFSGSYTRYALYGGGAKNNDDDYGVMAKSFRVAGNNSFYASSPKLKRGETERKGYNKISLFCTPRSDVFGATLVVESENIVLEQQICDKEPVLIRWNLDTLASDFTIKLAGEADVYGVLVDNDYGVAVDNIPMRGASGTFLSQMNDTLLAYYYEMLDVGMIILQFGGNAVPSLYSEDGVNYYVKRIGDQIRYLQAVRPNVPILFIGPSDMSTRINGTMTTYTWLPILVERLQEIVLANGAAFWNLYQVMGGKNSMLSWVQKGWAGSDYIHFSPRGADQIGRVLTQSFQSMYEFYRLRKSNPDVDFDLVWERVLQDRKLHQSCMPAFVFPSTGNDSIATIDTLQQLVDSNYADTTMIFIPTLSDTFMIIPSSTEVDSIANVNVLQQPIDSNYVDSIMVDTLLSSDTIKIESSLLEVDSVTVVDTIQQFIDTITISTPPLSDTLLSSSPIF